MGPNIVSSHFHSKTEAFEKASFSAMKRPVFLISNKNHLAPPHPDRLFDTPLVKHRFDVDFNADSKYEI